METELIVRWLFGLVAGLASVIATLATVAWGVQGQRIKELRADNERLTNDLAALHRRIEERRDGRA